MKKINYKSEFGRRVRHLRKEVGLTQEELSELMAITSQHLSYVESGRRGPSFEFIISVSQALDISPSELFLFESKSSKQTNERLIKQIDLLLKNLDIKELKKLLKLIRLLW